MQSDSSSGWPPAMVLEIDLSRELAELLYFGRLSGVSPAVELGELDGVIVTPPAEPASQGLTTTWWGAWKAVWAAKRISRDASRAGRGGSQVSDDLAALLGSRSVRLPGASTRDRASLRTWLSGLAYPDVESFGETPEDRALPALRGAWERGLRTIEILPLRTSRIAGPLFPEDSDLLTVATTVRSSPHDYAAVLEEFGRGHRTGI